MQKSLFEDYKDNSVKKDLIIRKKGEKAILSKQQQAFNRHVKKIEKLQWELTNTTAILDEKLNYYAAHLHPLQLEITSLRKKIIPLLYSFYTNKTLLSKTEKEALREILDFQITEVLKFESEPDDALKKIFEKICGLKYEDAVEEDFQYLKNDMREMFSGFGVDINLDDMHSQMSEAEIMAKLAQMKEDFQKNSGTQYSQQSRKKTKKQLEKEAKEQQIEEIKNKNLSVLYRQLAKLFHPDLITNPEEKIEKEELMKKLTAAYENKDLHTLLRLEMQWLQKEENAISEMAEEKLKVYNDVMKEQVRELEQQIALLYQHPRYLVLLNFANYPHHLKTLNLAHKLKDMKFAKADMERTITCLGKSEKEGLKEVKWVIADYKKQFYIDDDEFYDDMNAIEKISKRYKAK